MISNKPLYIQVYEKLSNDITARRYQVNDMLPTEIELAKELNVSRVTIRKALELLEKEGSIIRKAGFGTIVNYDKNDLKQFTMINCFSSEMQEGGLKGVTFSSNISILFADNELSHLFKVPLNSKIYNLKRIRGQKDKPLVYSDTYLSLPIELPITKDFLYGSLYSYLISKDITFSRFEEELEAMIPDQDLIKSLKLNDNVAILKRTRLGYNQKNELIEYTINYYDASFYKYNVEVNSIVRN